MKKLYKEVIILCTNAADYLQSMKLLQISGYDDVAGTPEDYAIDILKRNNMNPGTKRTIKEVKAEIRKLKDRNWILFKRTIAVNSP